MEYFITGVDTDIGKTYITKGLALYFNSVGKNVGVFKPLQSSAIKTEKGLIAPDLYEVEKLSNKIKTKCSYLFEGDVSPALAARISNVKVDINKIKNDFYTFSNQNEITFVEGAGGILAPATDDFLFADLIKALSIPIIIVTVPFLGRLNHTLLTINYAKSVGINIAGIIINKVPLKTIDLASQNFVDELVRYTDVKILGKIHQSTSLNLEEFSHILL